MAHYRLDNVKILYIKKVTESKEGPKVEVGDIVYTVETRGLRSDETIVKPETIERFKKIVERYNDTMRRLAE